MRLAYVNLCVRDLERAPTFDRDVLGLELPYASPEYGYASLSASPILLGLAVVGPDQADPDGSAPYLEQAAARVA